MNKHIKLRDTVLNTTKIQNDSNSQLNGIDNIKKFTVLNTTKIQNDSNSQPNINCDYSTIDCA